MKEKRLRRREVYHIKGAAKVEPLRLHGAADANT